ADASADAMEQAARQGASQLRQEPRPEPRDGCAPQKIAGTTPSAGRQSAQGAPQSGQQGGEQGAQQGAQQNGRQNAGASQAAQQASAEMQQAADKLEQARQGQIDEWKNELSGELDRAIQETMQMAREQADVEQQARAGADPSSLRSQQAAVQQGVEQT